MIGSHLSLFSGIGGLDLAAAWAGFRTVAFVEKDEFCQKVLAKNFPGVPIYGDIETFDPLPFRGISVISGGFPCQDASLHGKRSGLSGGRSSLWFTMLSVIERVRPLAVLVENVPGILSARGMGAESAIDTILTGLATAGYESETFVLGAWSVGSPQRRNRVFVVAFAESNENNARFACEVSAQESGRQGRNAFTWLRGVDGGGQGTERARRFEPGMGGAATRIPAGMDGDYWPAGRDEKPRPNEPERLTGVADPADAWRASRLKALGNAVCPQQAYPFFAAIAERLKGASK